MCWRRYYGAYCKERQAPPAEPPQQRSPAGWIEPADSEFEAPAATTSARMIPAQTVHLTPAMATDESAADKKLSARALRKRLRNPQSLRQAILLNEILNKPLALRHRQIR